MNDPGELPDEYFDDDYGYEGYCYECDGRHWKITCIDDLCYGQDECIHGHPPKPCPVCNPKGLLEDGSL